MPLGSPSTPGDRPPETPVHGRYQHPRLESRQAGLDSPPSARPLASRSALRRRRAVALLSIAVVAAGGLELGLRALTDPGMSRPDAGHRRIALTGAGSALAAVTLRGSEFTPTPIAVLRREMPSIFSQRGCPGGVQRNKRLANLGPRTSCRNYGSYWTSDSVLGPFCGAPGMIVGDFEV